MEEELCLFCQRKVPCCALLLEHFALPLEFNPEMAFDWVYAAIMQLAACHPKKITVLKGREDLVLPTLVAIKMNKIAIENF